MKRLIVTVLIGLSALSCTPTVKKVAFHRDRGDIVVVQKGSFKLTEEEKKFIRLEAKRLGIPVPGKKEIRRELRLFLRNKRGMEIALRRAGLYIPYITPILKSYALPEELAILPLIESRFNPFAVSRSGAGGIWQLMPATARRFGLRVGKYVDERFDLYRSTHAAARYLKELYRRFGNWELVLAAYNCGEGCVLKKTGGKDFWNRKYRLPEQTRRFVPRFFAALLIARNPEKYGLRVTGSPLKVRRTLVSRTQSIKDFVKRASLKESTFRDLNPHIRGDLIPANTHVYVPQQERRIPTAGKDIQRIVVKNKVVKEEPAVKRSLKVKRKKVVVRTRKVRKEIKVQRKEPYEGLGKVVERGGDKTVIVLDNGAVVYIKE